jgi:hypothetical protein
MFVAPLVAVTLGMLRNLPRHSMISRDVSSPDVNRFAARAWITHVRASTQGSSPAPWPPPPPARAMRPRASSG